MGIFLSRLNLNNEALVFYIMSLVQQEYRSLMRFTLTRKWDSRRASASRGEASTQTGHDNPRHSSDKSDDVNTAQYRAGESPCSKKSPQILPDVNDIENLFGSPDTAVMEGKTSFFPAVAMGVSVRVQRNHFHGIDTSSPIDAMNPEEAEFNGDSPSTCKGCFNFPGCASGLVRNLSCNNGDDETDVQIIENPDFISFGEAYRNLASPHDKWASEPRCRCVTSLSPVKEEPENDASNDKFGCHVSADSAVSDVTFTQLHSTALGDIFPAFDDAPHDGYDKRGSSSYGKRLLFASASSDSGFGERLRSSCSSTVSSSYSASGATASDASDISRRSSSDSSNADDSDSHTQDVQISAASTAHQEGDVFHEDDDPFHTEEETPRPAAHIQAAKTPLIFRRSPAPSLASVCMRARRKVTFSDDSDRSFGSNNETSASAAAAAASAPVSRIHLPPTTFLGPPSIRTPPSSGVPLSNARHRLVLHRQDSSESATSSSCSSSSSDSSVLAVPFSPRSPDSSTLISSFSYPGIPDTRPNHSFCERREGCDLVLIADGERFFVHTSVVAWQCHTLMLHLRDTLSREVLLLDRCAEDVVSFLQLLYPYHKSNLSERNMEAMLDLAHYLGCERVKRICTTFLLGLAQFPHLCDHHHLQPNLPNGHPMYQQHQNHGPQGAVLSSESSEDGQENASSDTGHYMFEHVRQSQATSMCACADTMPERLLNILELSVRFNLDDVYNSFLDVAAKMKTDDLSVCSRYLHLSSAMREDILTARVRRLENIVGSVGISREDLVNCNHSRHSTFRVAFNGRLCLKCTSRSAVRQAKKIV